MHKLSRREVLRGAGVAALSVGAAVVPFAARAMCDSAPGVADDPRLFDLAKSAVIINPERAQAGSTHSVKVGEVSGGLACGLGCRWPC